MVYLHAGRAGRRPIIVKGIPASSGKPARLHVSAGDVYTLVRPFLTLLSFLCNRQLGLFRAASIPSCCYGQPLVPQFALTALARRFGAPLITWSRFCSYLTGTGDATDRAAPGKRPLPTTRRWRRQRPGH